MAEIKDDMAYTMTISMSRGEWEEFFKDCKVITNELYGRFALIKFRELFYKTLEAVKKVDESVIMVPVELEPE